MEMNSACLIHCGLVCQHNQKLQYSVAEHFLFLHLRHAPPSSVKLPSLVTGITSPFTELPPISAIYHGYLLLFPELFPFNIMAIYTC